MKPLKVFYHMIDLPAAHEIGKEQVKLLFDSNLTGHAEIFLCLCMDFDSPTWDWVKQIFKGWPNVHIVDMEADQKEYEMPTLIYLKEACDSAKEPFYCLYFHEKGCTWKGNPNEQNVRDWRNLMEYYNILHWKDCVAELDKGYDMCGVNYRTLPLVQDPHYSGGFWWARSEYIQKIPKLVRPKDNGYQCQFMKQDDPPDPLKYRMECELWHGRARPKYAVLHDSWQDHYWFPYPKERYRND